MKILIELKKEAKKDEDAYVVGGEHIVNSKDEAIGWVNYYYRVLQRHEEDLKHFIQIKEDEHGNEQGF